MKFGKKVALDKTFKMISHIVTLGEVQGHGGHWNFGKKYNYCIYRDYLNIYSIVMKLGKNVPSRMTFKIIWWNVTLTECQGQSGTLNLEKNAIFDFFNDISANIYSRIMKLGQKVAFGEPLIWYDVRSY